MDDTVVLSSEEILQRNFRTFSKLLTASLVERMSNCLYRFNKITKHELQMITSHPTDMQKASRMMQIVIKKGQSTCSSFLSCLGICDPMLYEKVTGFPVTFSKEAHQHSEEISTFDNVKYTPCIINIQNSSLSNCIIGNNNRQFTSCVQHSLLSTNDLIKADDMADSQGPLIPGQETSDNSVHMEKSTVKCVIIGDHNNMSVTESSYSEV